MAQSFPSPRLTLTEAQTKIKALLDTQVPKAIFLGEKPPYEWRPDKVPVALQETIKMNSGNTKEFTWASDDIDNHLENEVLYFKWKKPTVRDYLGLLSHELGDLFVSESSRNQARTIYPDEYKQCIEIENQAPMRYPGMLPSMIAFIDSMAALADQGIRPSPKVLREGIATLRQKAAYYKELEAEAKGQSLSADFIEDRHYTDTASSILYRYIANKELPEEVTGDIRNVLESMGREPDNEAMLAAISAIAGHLEKTAPMTAKDYHRVSSAEKSTMRVIQSEADIILNIIQTTQEVAKGLGVDLSYSQERGQE